MRRSVELKLTSTRMRRNSKAWNFGLGPMMYKTHTNIKVDVLKHRIERIIDIESFQNIKVLE